MCVTVETVECCVAQAVRESQERRQTLMTEMCKKYFSASNKTSQRRYPKMFSSDNQRFLYCIVPKVEHHLQYHFRLHASLARSA